MMNEFEVVEMWNYTTNKYQQCVICRTFNNGGVAIQILKRL